MRTFFALLLGLVVSVARADMLVGYSAYENGDYLTAFQNIAQSANTGNPEAMYMLGRMYQYGQGVNKDYKKSIQWYQKAADKGNAMAQLSLGFMYDRGIGVDKNYA